MNHTIAMTQLMNGSIMAAIESGYSETLPPGWFWLIIYLLTITIAYIRMRSITYPVMISILFSAVGWMLLPIEATIPMLFFTAAGVAAIFYRAWKS